MRIRSIVAVVALGFGPNLFALAAQPQPTGRVAYVNGQLFDGKGFRPGNLVVEGGRFVEAAPSPNDETVDLKGGFVLPPFGEAHNHNIHHQDELAEKIAGYLREGVFYVKNPSSVLEYTAALRDRINRPDSVDVTFSGPPFTCPGGHPQPLHERLLGLGIDRYPGRTKETLGGWSYQAVETEADIDRVWAQYLAGRPDFVKVILINSEMYGRDGVDPKTIAGRGLDPALLPGIVRRASEAGLEVSAHIDSPYDFAIAVRSGVKELAHLPGRREPQRLADEDIAEAARRGVTVVTTARLARRNEDKPELFQEVRKAQADNLQRLLAAGVRLAVGSDQVDEEGGTVVDEAEYLVGLGLPADAVLRAWTEGSAFAAFPKRRLGRLEPGYEASFVVLGGDPLKEFAAVRRVLLRVKSGHTLSVP